MGGAMTEGAMRNEGCAAFRREISEVLGRREDLSLPCAAHLETCQECSAYASLVAALAAGPLGEAPGPEWLTADEALGAASRILSRRREARQFALFLLLAASAMGAWTWVGISGQGWALLALQALAFMALPFACLAALGRNKKGASA